MTEKQTSKLQRKKHMRRIIEEYARPARDLFLYYVVRKKPHLQITISNYSLNSHIMEILFLVLPHYKNIDIDLWPPPEILVILNEAVIKYVDSLL